MIRIHDLLDSNPFIGNILREDLFGLNNTYDMWPDALRCDETDYIAYIKRGRLHKRRHISLWSHILGQVWAISAFQTAWYDNPRR
jgi:hypothetical protein